MILIAKTQEECQSWKDVAVVFDVLRDATAVCSLVKSGKKDIRIFKDSAIAEQAFVSLPKAEVFSEEYLRIPHRDLSLAETSKSNARNPAFVLLTDSAKAIWSLRQARTILLGGFCNFQALREALQSQNRDVLLIPASLFGSEDDVEDALCTESFRDFFQGIGDPQETMDDFRSTLRAVDYLKNGPKTAKEDLKMALRINGFPSVPQVKCSPEGSYGVCVTYNPADDSEEELKKTLFRTQLAINLKDMSTLSQGQTFMADSVQGIPDQKDPMAQVEDASKKQEKTKGWLSGVFSKILHSDREDSSALGKSFQVTASTESVEQGQMDAMEGLVAPIPKEEEIPVKEKTISIRLSKAEDDFLSTFSNANSKMFNLGPTEDLVKPEEKPVELPSEKEEKAIEEEIAVPEEKPTEAKSAALEEKSSAEISDTPAVETKSAEPAPQEPVVTPEEKPVENVPVEAPVQEVSAAPVAQVHEQPEVQSAPEPVMQEEPAPAVEPAPVTPSISQKTPCKKAIVLFSGGLDSTTCLYWALSQGYTCEALTVSYGQRHEREIQSAQCIAQELGIKHHIITLDLPWLQASSLVDASSAIPDVPVDHIGKGGIPPTYVPGRNLMFLSLAGSLLDVVGAQAIVAGPNAVDFSGYPDCTPAFFKAASDALNRGTKQGVLEGIEVLAPLIHLSKAEIVKLAVKLGVPFGLTWSCYAGGDKPCGHCDSCKLRAKGFEEAGIHDTALDQ